MIDFSQDYFALFGLPPRYRFDLGGLEAAYRALQSEVHPDRFATAHEVERRLALQSSARVNEAYRALKDPIGRAQHLLSLRGIDVFSETETDLPLDFLERQLERREAVAEAKARRDTLGLEILLAEARADTAALESELGDRLDETQDFNAARTVLRELRFLHKVIADIELALGDLEE